MLLLPKYGVCDGAREVDIACQGILASIDSPRAILSKLPKLLSLAFICLPLHHLPLYRVIVG